MFSQAMCLFHLAKIEKGSNKEEVELRARRTESNYHVDFDVRAERSSTATVYCSLCRFCPNPFVYGLLMISALPALEMY